MHVLLPVAHLLALYVSVLLLQPIFCLFAASPAAVSSCHYQPVFRTPACLLTSCLLPLKLVRLHLLDAFSPKAVSTCLFSVFILSACLSLSPSPSYVFLIFWPSEFLNFLSSGYLSTICTFFPRACIFLLPVCQPPSCLSVYCLSTALLSVCLLSVNRPPVCLSAYLPEVFPPSQSLLSTLWYSVYIKTKNLQYRQLFRVHYFFRVLQNIKKTMEFWGKVPILLNSVEKIACIFRVVLSSRLLYGRPPK